MESYRLNNSVSYSCFENNKGADEIFIICQIDTKPNFKSSLNDLYKYYLKALNKLNLTKNSQVFNRFYLSDIANQKKELLESKIFSLCKNGSYSVIQESPLDGKSISLIAYHIQPRKKVCKKELYQFDDEGWRNGVKISGINYDIYVTGNFSGFGALDSFEQTNEIFLSYNSFINDHAMTLLKNTVRTWVYVRDIDNHYQGMVDARRNYFLEQGLTKETRFIAATGIEAKLKEPSTLVSLDAISVAGLDNKQIIRMEALQHLNPTHEYGVTFERGAKVEFGDRAHLYISGTASIDKNGQVMYVGDIKKQTRRVLENINALLKPHGAKLTDLAYLIVYLRNITEIGAVKSIIQKENLGNLPTLFVEGSVCRLGWLVEMEGIGIISIKSSWPDFT